MIDHVMLHVNDYDRSKKFYANALKPLGYEVVMEMSRAGGLGVGGKPDFWIDEGVKPQSKTHIAFAAQTRKQVDQFYKEAIAAGGQDNGKPGLRKHYHDNYYGAFVTDFDGNNVEVVCHKPE
ncbi:MAG TPA: VOC family protein [Myxococcales bacterium]|nr:VOC family protein [Myxococcales bacterium]